MSITEQYIKLTKGATRGVLYKSCLQEFCNIHRKTHFPVNIAKFLRASFFKNICVSLGLSFWRVALKLGI